MTLSHSDFERLHSLALEAAKRAGRYVQSMLGRHQETRTKEAGDTPAAQFVTEVDLESQRLILDTLEASMSEHDLGLLTEERADDSSRLKKDYFWCIDPLDGTLPFINGSPGYSVSIALVSRLGIARIGVIHDPVAAETFHAMKGGGAFRNGETISCAPSNDGGSLTWILDQSMKQSALHSRLSQAMAKLADETGAAGLSTIDHAGAALNGSWVTQHAPAVYFKFPKKPKGGGSLWDFAASACLLEEWGVPATDIWGRPLELNRSDNTFLNECGVIYASHPKLREAIQRIYRTLAPG